jgi:hypothetical protein
MFDRNLIFDKLNPSTTRRESFGFISKLGLSSAALILAQSVVKQWLIISF